MPSPNPRLIAARILSEYARGRTNLSSLISLHLSHHPETEDKGFVRELVWGTIRRLNTIDWIIDRFAREPQKVQPEVRAVLRLGVFQLMYLTERVPEYAAVDETVDLVRAFGKRQAVSFVNGVLRSFLRGRDTLPWPQESDDVAAIVLKESHPRWLVERWVKRWGQDAAREMCAADNAPAPFTIRANTSKISRAELWALLENEGVKAESCRYAPDGLVLESRPELGTLGSYGSGFFVVQDEASQLVSRIVDPQEGETVLDLCCGSGIKTTHLAQLMQGKGRVIAADISPQQLAEAKRLVNGLGLRNVQLLEADARTLKDIAADRILIDAPCSGLGAIRRKPDIKWNRTEEDIVRRYPPLQKEILAHAAALLKPGGSITYSTCTTEPEEDEEIVADFLTHHPAFTKAALPLPGELLTENGTFFRSFPHRHGMDGFFAAKLTRK